MHFYAEKLGEILCLILATFWLLLFFRTDLPEEKFRISEQYLRKNIASIEYFIIIPIMSKLFQITLVYAAKLKKKNAAFLYLKLLFTTEVFLEIAIEDWPQWYFSP